MGDWNGVAAGCRPVDARTPSAQPDPSSDLRRCNCGRALAL